MIEHLMPDVRQGGVARRITVPCRRPAFHVNNAPRLQTLHVTFIESS